MQVTMGFRKLRAAQPRSDRIKIGFVAVPFQRAANGTSVQFRNTGAMPFALSTRYSF